MKNRSTVIAGLSILMSLALGASSANALSLDARIGGVFTDSMLSTPAPGATVNAQGNVLNYQMNVGEFILVDIIVANPEGDLIEAIFATLIYDGSKLDYIGSVAPGFILVESGFSSPTALFDIGSGAIKGNTPNPPGAPGDVWIQAVAYGPVGGGSRGTGPDTISLLFQVTGASSSGLAFFDLSLTAGDAISGAGQTTFSGAIVTVMPEPSSALLIGLGLAGLAIRSRDPRPF